MLTILILSIGVFFLQSLEPNGLGGQDENRVCIAPKLVDDLRREIDPKYIMSDEQRNQSFL
jgi:hypothetical protein